MSEGVPPSEHEQEERQTKELSDAKSLFESLTSDADSVLQIDCFCQYESAEVRAYGEALKELTTTTAPSPPASPEAISASTLTLRTAPGVDAETLLIISDEVCTWSQAYSAELNEEMAKARRDYVLQDGSDQQPPQILQVPAADQVSAFALFRRAKLSNLALAKAFPFGRGYGEPPTNWESDADAYFVEQRMMGVNPCALTKISDEARTYFSEATFPRDGTFYMCDYKPLEPFSRELAEASNSAYIPAPICIFKYDEARKSMQPVAILLDRAASSPQVVYHDDEPLKWRYAKMCVRTADWNAHELGSHLTLAHFVTEVACVVTHASLPRRHPIFQLLLPHFFRTLPLNANARSTLVPSIIASGLSALNQAQCLAFSAAVFKAWDFAEHYVPRDLEKRGVDALPLAVYPYTTTAKAVWNCIHTYVDSLLTALAEVDRSKSLLDDYHLQNWCTQMRSRMPGFPDIINTDMLCSALTMVIYTATHQHSAVNYFQRKYMTFLPASPGFLATGPPADLRNLTEESLQNALPRLSRTQTALVDMLSDAPDAEHRLSNFDLASSPAAQYVRWNPLRLLLQPFQAELAAELRPFSADVMVSTTNLAQSVLI